jgi:signal transduction histidine kinase
VLRLTADLSAERRERIRSQERAEVAAHVHDSVLQTLALIRKAADDPREVQRLARTQERELRAGSTRRPRRGDDLQSALEQARPR